MAATEPTAIAVPATKDPSILNPAAGKEITAERWYNAGVMLQGSDNVAQFQDGSTWTEKQLYEKALEINVELGAAYSNLAALVQRLGTEATISDQPWSVVQLYVRTLELEPAEVVAYINLAVLLQPADKVTLNGDERDRIQLCMQAMANDPTSALAYLNLGVFTQSAGPPIMCPDGETRDSQSLFEYAKMLDPKCVPVTLPA